MPEDVARDSLAELHPTARAIMVAAPRCPTTSAAARDSLRSSSTGRSTRSGCGSCDRRAESGRCRSTSHWSGAARRCLLSPGRNPQLTREQVEQRLGDHLGVDGVVWLPRGIERRLALDQVPRRSQLREAATDDADIGFDAAAQRRAGRPGIGGQRLLEPEAARAHVGNAGDGRSSTQHCQGASRSASRSAAARMRSSSARTSAGSGAGWWSRARRANSARAACSSDA